MAPAQPRVLPERSEGRTTKLSGAELFRIRLNALLCNAFFRFVAVAQFLISFYFFLFDHFSIL